jgi:hypothetical protein
MATPVTDPRIMRRLAFIRLLYQQGVGQSQLPEPLSFSCVLTFHDTIELFVILAAEHLQAALPQAPRTSSVTGRCSGPARHFLPG